MLIPPDPDLELGSVSDQIIEEERALYPEATRTSDNLDVKDEPRSGRPVTDKDDTILDRIEQDRQISSYDTAKKLEI
ncbi:hypothetical protein EVAR_51259_1 [Eumeta japonica]|uniref:Uncharacterized protein n=1 Tax=Eumeta variegata TaxID=151549 RepID=A0A4C1YAF7_EUMVA|nr:hypothetical protein EVAR_51259_1 [Eumeta japonica]